MKKVFKFSLLSQIVIGVFVTAFLTTAIVSAATTIGTNITTAGTLEVTGNTITLGGTTPTMTVGDAGAEDAAIVYNGNAQDFYVGLDDSVDDLVFGLGSALGTTQALGIDENLLVTMSADALLNGTTPTLTMGDAGAEDTQINFDGNAVDFSFGLDDSADKLVLGLGSTLGTTQRMTFNSGDLGILIGDATAADSWLTFDGNAQDFYIGLDDSADDLIIGFGSVVGTTPVISINEAQLTTIAAGVTVTAGNATVTAGDTILTDGRIIGAIESSPNNCAANAVTIPLATDQKFVAVADQAADAACTVSLSGGTAGELVILELIYGGDRVWNFSAGTIFSGGAFDEDDCTALQGVAADGDLLMVTGIMTDADTIMPIACQYIDQA
ncbi:MAG: hypothetical protein V1765_02405 [bacterium]